MATTPRISIIIHSSGPKPLYFKIKVTTPISTLVTVYTRTTDRCPTALSYDGALVYSDSTPADACMANFAAVLVVDEHLFSAEQWCEGLILGNECLTDHDTIRRGGDANRGTTEIARDRLTIDAMGMADLQACIDIA